MHHNTDAALKFRGRVVTRMKETCLWLPAVLLVHANQDFKKKVQKLKAEDMGN